MLIVYLCVFAGGIGKQAQANDISVTTLEWPPYTSSELPSGGATTALLMHVFNLTDVDATILTVPWKRALSMAKNKPAIDGYFPGYHCEHEEGFLRSDPVGLGPLGFAEHIEAELTWRTMSDLENQNLKIGTVSGYANTVEFDASVSSGKIRTIAAKDDLTNLKKLVRQRLDAVVIDQLVMSYLVATEESMKGVSDKLKFDETPLEEKKLFLCLTENDQNRELLEQFNSALSAINIKEFTKNYFDTRF